MENSKTIRVSFKGKTAELQQLPNGKWVCTNIGEFTKLGSSVTWLDDCRVPYNGEVPNMGGRGNAKMGGDQEYGFKVEGRPEECNTTGRFPANILVSDDVLNDGTLGRARGNKKPEVRRSFAFGQDCEYPHESGAGDSGSYSRFFDLDAWAKTLPFLIVPKAAKSEKNAGLAEFPDRASEVEHGNIGRAVSVEKRRVAQGINAATTKNIHPTVKPLKLMSYLITLGSRPGDVVLDPFLGSGTTAIAAKQLGREYIGIEREEEYVKIAEARLEAVHNSLGI